MPDSFRCSVSSEADHETLAGTAPTDRDWLLVEHNGPWGRKAVAESRLPAEVVDHLGRQSARVQLVRRYVPSDRRPGVRVFTAALGGARPVVRSAVLDDVGELLDLTDADLTPYAGPMWLVCTNGRRDVCCAERGRLVADALADLDPAATWETTHLGGHRFAPTLLALPSGFALGRLDQATAMASSVDLARGEVPLAFARGRAGWPAPAQVADLHLRVEHGWTRVDDVTLLDVDGDVDGDGVRLATPQGPALVRVETTPGPPRRQSCADLQSKATSEIRVVGVTMGA